MSEQIIDNREKKEVDVSKLKVGDYFMSNHLLFKVVSLHQAISTIIDDGYTTVHNIKTNTTTLYSNNTKVVPVNVHVIYTIKS